MDIFMLFSLLSSTNAYSIGSADEYSEGDRLFCSKDLTGDQILSEFAWINEGCKLWCGVIDLSKPMGSMTRFPKINNPVSLVPCRDDDHICIQGKCVLKGNFSMSDIIIREDDDDLKSQILRKVTDREIRKCYEGLLPTEWVIDAVLQKNPNRLECVITNTAKDFGRKRHRVAVFKLE